jgi:quercetin dioxygenase-like cupin family protein
MGGPAEEIYPRNMVWIAPGEKHRYGAAPTTAITHIAIQEYPHGQQLIGWNRSALTNIE